MYQALYRTWRPRTFDDVVGQSHITETLKRQVAAGRLSHAYLFTGTRGTGKTSCAKILAKAVNCEHPVDGNPCNQCPACVGIDNGSILDVLELDAASNNGVDQVRALRDEAVYTPAAVRKRVYIVDEVHMLSTAAFNALLKILEEPPAHLMFILATTELHKVPATIKSRCQQFSFKRILPGDIARRLEYVAQQEHIALTPEGAALLARLADGGLRDALSLLDQCASPEGTLGEEEVLSALGLAGNLETARLMEQIAAGETAGALETLERLYAAGKDLGALVGELSALARDLLVRRTAPSGGAALLTGGYDEATLRRLTNALEPRRLMQMVELLQATANDLPRSSNRRTDVELCLIRLCDTTLDSSPAGVLARLARLEERLAGGVPVQAAPADSGEKAPPKTKKTTRRAPARQQEAPPVSTPAPVEQGSSAPSAPAEEDRPPWEEERPPLPEEPLWEDEAPAQQTAPAAPPAPKKSAPVRAPSAGGDSTFWPDLVAELRRVVPMSIYPFLCNSTSVKGWLEGEVLTIWLDGNFMKNMVGTPEVLQSIARTAERMLGHPVRCTVSVGGSPAPAAAPQKKRAAAKRDRLDELVETGKQFDNVIIE
ncbi:MAG TPA: DNA polymerase III subunit gamma/tau [Candidatus Flavonifractor merdigallinarum]|uniref:DNA-directed DNA polymerase n=1 Tax=Candidatus Flavonifractor merdigallinarum TaxID=2838589 RepID=A0A9D1Y8I6_9FIRM|nr:DNA polymerase III subunit gamma/tau [Candidatus Flavonifractor merdigallinarum]